MNIIKLGSVMAVFSLVACGQGVNQENTKSAAVDPQEVEEAASSPVRYNEFVWCSNGENATADNLVARDALWSESVSELGMDELMSANLKPVGWSSESFDSLTLLMWPDKDARNAGWTAYQDSGIEEKLNENFADVEICGGVEWANVYGFDVYQPRQASKQASTEDAIAYAGYQFCSFNEGNKAADLRKVVMGSYTEFLQKFETEVGPTSYNFLVQIPDFDAAVGERHNGVPPQFDLMWTNFWGDKTEKAMGDKAWAESGASIQESFDAVMTCSDEQGYDLTITKNRKV